jgi:hypothetical protein
VGLILVDTLDTGLEAGVKTDEPTVVFPETAANSVLELATTRSIAEPISA